MIRRRKAGGSGLGGEAQATGGGERIHAEGADFHRTVHLKREHHEAIGNGRIEDARIPRQGRGDLAGVGRVLPRSMR